MAKKIKVELTKEQFFAASSALHSHCLDIMGAEFIDPQMATENRVITNALDAMDKGYDEWKK